MRGWDWGETGDESKPAYSQRHKTKLLRELRLTNQQKKKKKNDTLACYAETRLALAGSSNQGNVKPPE